MGFGEKQVFKDLIIIQFASCIEVAGCQQKPKLTSLSYSTHIRLLLYIFVYNYFPTRMSNRANIMGLQFQQWTTNERIKAIHPQNKVIQPRIAAEEGTERQHLHKWPLCNKDEQLLAKTINSSRIRDLSKVDSRVDTSYSNTSATDSIKDSRSLKNEIVKEIKSWIKAIETAGKEPSSLLEMPLVKLDNALYRWCFFIQQNTCCSYKSDYNIQTPNHLHHTLSLDLPKNPEDTPKRCSDRTDSLLMQQKEHYEKQIQKLSMRIRETQEQIETNRVYNRQSLRRIAQLQLLFHAWSAKVRRDAVKQRQENDAIDALLSKNEKFLRDIKQTITQGKETPIVVQKIEEKLEHLKEYKQQILVTQ